MARRVPGVVPPRLRRHDGCDDMTISAADWVAGASVAPGVFERWPGYRVVLVASDAVDRAAVSSVVDEWFAAAVADARALDGEVDPHVARWHEAFRDFGVKPRMARPSVDALLRRAGSPAGLPRITPLVDAYNAVSMACRVPIGGEDLNHYLGPPRLLLATGDEPFPVRADGAIVVDHPEPGEPVWVDDEGVTCRRWNWRQTVRTAISEATVRVGFIVDWLDAAAGVAVSEGGAGDDAAGSADGAASAAERLAQLVSEPIVRVIDGPRS